MDQRAFTSLITYLSKVPAIDSNIASGIDEEGLWWVKFSIDIEHEHAWHVVQELGSVVNCLSIKERLPTIFYPVSPPPYMNGGPYDFLSWVIESKDKAFRPGMLQKWLEGRLPMVRKIRPFCLVKQKIYVLFIKPIKSPMSSMN